MASEWSMHQRALDAFARFRKVESREQRDRDRSLTGKARVKARKAANKSKSN